MLYVKTKVAPSKIHGLGLFADQFISKGTIIWKYTENCDLRLTKNDIENLPELAKEHLEFYGWLSKKSGFFCHAVDNGKYFNHSDDPNCIAEYIDGEDEVVVKSICDIKVGEEITDDYYAFTNYPNLALSEIVKLMGDAVVKEDTELVFQEERITTKENLEYSDIAVKWFDPVMRRVSEILTEKNGDILEIGFGMGILSNYIQEKNVKSHTIFEINKKIYENALEWAKNKPNVNLILGDWYENLDLINSKKYDGIYYDADCKNGYRFRELVVDKSLKEDGVFSYFFPNLDYSYHKTQEIDVFKYNKNLIVEFIELDYENLDDNNELIGCNYHDDYFATLPYVKYPLKK
jgi:ferredoxin-fold anticodon binding domain-containing protein